MPDVNPSAAEEILIPDVNPSAAEEILIPDVNPSAAEENGGSDQHVTAESHAPGLELDVASRELPIQYARGMPRLAPKPEVKTKTMMFGKSVEMTNAGLLRREKEKQLRKLVGEKKYLSLRSQ